MNDGSDLPFEKPGGGVKVQSTSPQRRVVDGQEWSAWEQTAQGAVACRICAHACSLEAGQVGICRVWRNREGVLNSVLEHRALCHHLSPVERKPFYHCLPGSRTYSIGAHGCSLRCPGCLNEGVSQLGTDGFLAQSERLLPPAAVAMAQRAECTSITFAYSEPTIAIEQVEPIALAAREAHLPCLIKTNGFLHPSSLDYWAELVDAANIDLKAFRDATYRRFGGRLAPVLHALSEFRRRGLWIEVSTVVIPGVNDSDQELQELAGHLVAHLGPDTPWHVMKFFPYGGLAHLPPTPLATLRRARTIGLAAGLRYVYLGNIKVPEEQSTCCPTCANVLIRRSGASLLGCTLANGGCPACGTAIPGYWLGPCVAPAPSATTNHETNSNV